MSYTLVVNLATQGMVEIPGEIRPAAYDSAGTKIALEDHSRKTILVADADGSHQMFLVKGKFVAWRPAATTE